MNGFSLYWRYAKLHIKEFLAYTGWPMTMLSALLFVVMDPLDMLFMLERFGGVGKWSGSSLMLMYSIALTSFGLAELFGRGFDSFPPLVRNGEFDRVLLRPRSLFLQSMTLRFHLTRLVRVSGGLLLMIYALRAQDTAMTMGNILILLGALIGGTMVYIGIFILGAAHSFFAVDAGNWIYVFTNGSYQAAKVPPQYLPKWMRGMFQFVMPMLLFSYYPASAICGWGEPLWTGLLALPVGAAFMALTLIAFRFGVRHYRSAGG